MPAWQVRIRFRKKGEMWLTKNAETKPDSQSYRGEKAFLPLHENIQRKTLFSLIISDVLSDGVKTCCFDPNSCPFKCFFMLGP